MCGITFASYSDVLTSSPQVLDIGCGEGETIGCLCNPAPWRAPLVIPHAEPGTLYPTLHIRSIQGLDVSAHELKCAAQETAPPKDGGYGHVRWEPLDVKLWHGGLESFNPDFVGVECIVSTEVYVCSELLWMTQNSSNGTHQHRTPS